MRYIHGVLPLWAYSSFSSSTCTPSPLNLGLQFFEQVPKGSLELVVHDVQVLSF